MLRLPVIDDIIAVCAVKRHSLVFELFKRQGAVTELNPFDLRHLMGEEPTDFHRIALVITGQHQIIAVTAELHFVWFNIGKTNNVLVNADFGIFRVVFNHILPVPFTEQIGIRAEIPS